jgi:hypothetical protein
VKSGERVHDLPFRWWKFKQRVNLNLGDRRDWKKLPPPSSIAVAMMGSFLVAFWRQHLLGIW